MLRTLWSIWKTEVILKRMYIQTHTNLHRKDFIFYTFSIWYSCLGKNHGVIPDSSIYLLQDKSGICCWLMFIVHMGVYLFKPCSLVYLGLFLLSRVFINIIISFLTFLSNVQRASFTAKWVINFIKLSQQYLVLCYTVVSELFASVC